MFIVTLYRGHRPEGKISFETQWEAEEFIDMCETFGFFCNLSMKNA